MKKKRTYNLARIKNNLSYFVPEVCESLGVHKNTVRQWLKKGLPKNDAIKPLLIHGSELKAFLAAQQSARKQPCNPEQCYCFKCKQPRSVWSGVVDIHLCNSKVINIVGLCEHCERQINKRSSVNNIPQIANTFIIQAVHNSHIIETLPPSLKCYLERLK